MKLLTNIQICELMEWLPRDGYRDKAYVTAPSIKDTIGWTTPTGKKIEGTPNFDTMNPWFNFVIPWFLNNGWSYYIHSYDKGHRAVLKTNNSTLVGLDKDPAMAFRKALTEYANRSY